MARPLTGPDEAATSPDRGPVWRPDVPSVAPSATTAPAPGRGRHAAGRHASPAPRRRWWGWILVALREVALVGLTALALSIVIRLLVVQPYYVPSPSMQDTLQPQDRVAVLHGLGLLGGVSRGDVIVFEDPGGWLPTGPGGEGSPWWDRALGFLGFVAVDEDTRMVERVIGIGGDRITCCDAQGRILLNGEPLDEAYLKPGTATDQVLFDVVVPDGTVFVMGDNRAFVQDSRAHLSEDSGGVPLDSVVGRAFAVVWPRDRAGVIPSADAFADVAPQGP
ncbi:MAG: signal peptidase I [bacterium]